MNEDVYTVVYGCIRNQLYGWFVFKNHITHVFHGAFPSEQDALDALRNYHKERRDKLMNRNT